MRNMGYQAWVDADQFLCIDDPARQMPVLIMDASRGTIRYSDIADLLDTNGVDTSIFNQILASVP